jgi:ABC-type sugar transport system ATPase subunit
VSELFCESVCYGDALHDVSLSLQRGRICALLGPSGAGKSTLLWLLAGLWRPGSGRVVCDTKKLGMVFQQPGLWDHLTVEQHLKIVGADSDRAEQALEAMNLTDLCRRRPGTISGGERQRLSIARALAIDPVWLLLDEPMAHLDGPSRTDLFDLLRSALTKSNAGILFATHHAEEAMRLADDCAILIDGRITQHGTAEHVYHHPANLASAQTTGPAFIFNGQITRPEQLTFTPDPAGDAVVQRCEFLGCGYLLRVTVNAVVTTTASTSAVSVGTHGRLSTRHNTTD